MITILFTSSCLTLTNRLIVTFPEDHRYVSGQKKATQEGEELTILRGAHQGNNISMTKLHFLAISLKPLQIDVCSIGATKESLRYKIFTGNHRTYKLFPKSKITHLESRMQATTRSVADGT